MTSLYTRCCRYSGSCWLFIHPSLLQGIIWVDWFQLFIQRTVPTTGGQIRMATPGPRGRTSHSIETGWSPVEYLPPQVEESWIHTSPLPPSSPHHTLSTDCVCVSSQGPKGLSSNLTSPGAKAAGKDGRPQLRMGTYGKPIRPMAGLHARG